MQCIILELIVGQKFCPDILVVTLFQQCMMNLAGHRQKMVRTISQKLMSSACGKPSLSRS